MRQFFIISLFLISITSYSQTIDGFCTLKFGAKQKDVLKLNWIKDSIIQQKQGENDLDVFVKNVKFNGKTYDICILRFYKKKLYSGLISKFSESKETLLQEADSLKTTIGITGLDFRNNEDNELVRLLFRDVNKNELLVEAINEKKLYVLRLHYYSADLTEKKNKEENKQRSDNSITIQVEAAGSN